LIQKLNSLLGSEKLEDSVLADAFETYWPRLEKAIELARKQEIASTPPDRPQKEILSELLENSRTQARAQSEVLKTQKRIEAALARNGGGFTQVPHHSSRRFWWHAWFTIYRADFRRTRFFPGCGQIHSI
jgi:hypothetical protein